LSIFAPFIQAWESTLYVFRLFRHDIALSYAKKAVQFMDEAYEHTLHTYTDPKERRQFIQIVATAYHNAAVEYEFLEFYD
jgi:hypothetical protein